MSGKAESIRKKIIGFAERVCDDKGLELFDVQYNSSAGGTGLLQVFIDAPDGGVTVDQIVKVSKELSTQLDVSNPIRGRYKLEVSSPGLNRKIRHLEDALAAVGENVKIVSEPIEGRKKFSGVLVAIENDTLIIEKEGNRYSVPWKMVKKANIDHQF